MTKALVLESTSFRSFVARVGRPAMVTSLILVMVWATLGCASFNRGYTSFSDAWDPGVEVRFPGAIPGGEAAIKSK